jgi:hypothetical protein
MITRVRNRTGISPLTRRGKPMPTSGDGGEDRRPTISSSKNNDFQFEIRNRKSEISSGGSLKSTYRAYRINTH